MLRPLALLGVLALAALYGTGCREDSSSGGDQVTATVAESPLDDLVGAWGGELHQEGLPPFEVAVVFDDPDRIRVAYTGIRCAGTWELGFVLLPANPVYTFTETIDRGAGGSCKGKGRVSLDKGDCEPIPDCAAYSFRGGGVSSRGVIRPIDRSAAEEVFSRAGVSLKAATFERENHLVNCLAVAGLEATGGAFLVSGAGREAVSADLITIGDQDSPDASVLLLDVIESRTVEASEDLSAYFGEPVAEGTYVTSAGLSEAVEVDEDLPNASPEIRAEVERCAA